MFVLVFCSFMEVLLWSTRIGVCLGRLADFKLSHECFIVRHECFIVLYFSHGEAKSASYKSMILSLLEGDCYCHLQKQWNLQSDKSFGMPGHCARLIGCQVSYLLGYQWIDLTARF